MKIVYTVCFSPSVNRHSCRMHNLLLNLLLTNLLFLCDTNDRGYINTKPDQLLTFTHLPCVTIRDALKVSKDLGPCKNIENQNSRKDPSGPGSGRVVYCVSLINEKKGWGGGREELSSAALEESSGVFWDLVKATHTCDRIGPWAPAGGVVGAVNDWQKMSGTAHQLRVDTQQADVTVCMIRGRVGSH